MDFDFVPRRNCVVLCVGLCLSASLVPFSKASPFRRSTASSLTFSTPFRRWQEQSIQAKQHDDMCVRDMVMLLELRGGSKRSDGISLEDTTTSASNPIVAKLRNVIRSVLKIGDQKAPSVSKTFRSFLKRLENILGVELLPKAPKKTRKERSGKRKKTKSINKAKQSKDFSLTTEEKLSLKNDAQQEQQQEQQQQQQQSKPTTANKKHLAQRISSNNPNYRIQKELKEFIKDPPPNLSVKVGKNIRIWIVTMVGAKGSIYEGEVYKLRISFPAQYPTVPPSVYFLPPNIPKHEHVYTNGDICLSLLGKDWRPTMTAQSIANSILSILSSAQSKSIPMDNAKHAQNKPGQYQEDWVYHDDNC